MKKYLIALLSIMVCLTTTTIAGAKSTTSNSNLSSAIKLYKAGNYSQSYTAFSNIVQKDPSNIVAYYYLAITSAQLGRKDEAIANYDKVLSLSPSGRLEYYARKGKICLEEPDKCQSFAHESADDNFIRSNFGSGFSDAARSQYEKQKIENLMREMNRKDDLSPSDFKNYKRFSSEAPSADEIVNAMEVLQRAGFNNPYGSYNDIYTYMSGRNSYDGLSPQVIQSLITNQLSF